MTPVRCHKPFARGPGPLIIPGAVTPWVSLRPGSAGHRLRGTPAILLPLLLAEWLVQCGCTQKDASPARRLEAQDASERISAIIELTERAQAVPAEHRSERRESLIPLLVDRLDDEDEGVRFYAILALEKLTGTRLGYDYRASASTRREGIRRWQRRDANSGARMASPGSPPVGTPALPAGDGG